MTAASIYSCRTAWRMIAASSIQGTGAQNLASAIRHGRSVVSGIALGPYFASRALASSLVRPGTRLSLSPGCPVSVWEAVSAVMAIIIFKGTGDRSAGMSILAQNDGGATARVGSLRIQMVREMGLLMREGKIWTAPRK